MAASVLANIAAKTDTPAATAPAAQGIATGNLLTGQYLYDRLIGNNQEQVTIMELIRAWSNTVDVASVKKALKDFVAIAKDKGEAQLNTARSHQSNIRTMYGALRFAPEQLKAEGFTDKTGYLVGKQIARKALADAMMKWDGSKLLSSEVKEQKAHTKEAQEAMTSVMSENPQLLTEDFSQWQERLRPMIQARIDANKAEKQAEAVAKICDNLVEKHSDLIKAIADELIRRMMHEDNVEEVEEE